MKQPDTKTLNTTSEDKQQKRYQRKRAKERELDIQIQRAMEKDRD